MKGVVNKAPVSVGVAVVTDVAGVIAYATHWNYVGPLEVVGFATFIHALIMLWSGYQIDSLTRRLWVQEWIYPVVLLWCGVFIALGVMAVFFAGSV